MESPIYCHVPVHFAATEEALSLYFAKCGVVENGVILTDKTTGQRKGSAYVAFASKDSAVKAVALSGATFFSRTLKVSNHLYLFCSAFKLKNTWTLFWVAELSHAIFCSLLFQ